MAESSGLNVFVHSGNEHIGPVKFEELRKLFDEGKIDRASLIWYNGLTSWITLGDLPGFDRRAPIKTTDPTMPIPEDHLLMTLQSKQELIKKSDLRSEITKKSIRRSDMVYNKVVSQWMRADQHPETQMAFEPPPLPGTVKTKIQWIPWALLIVLGCSWFFWMMKNKNP